MTGNLNWIQEAQDFQRSYNNIFAEWREFDREHSQYIKSTIGLMLFGIQPEVTNPPPTVNYYQVYDVESRKVIDTIYEHIMRKCGRKILLSCTYLVTKSEDNGIYSIVVLRFCRSPSEQIYFTEASGRYYTGWSDLLSSIQLPPCLFLAPTGGLYKLSTPIFELYKSPAATDSHQISSFINKVATGGALACTTASMFAFTPVFITAVGLGLSAYGVKQSISTLVDRQSHGQSISLDNQESILCYGNVVANGLAGVSVAAVSNIGRLQKVFGNSAITACKVLNVSAVVFDSSFLVYNTLGFMTKLKEGTVTSRDVFELSLQVFLVCGAVIQTRDMHRLLNQSHSSQSGTANRKLTRTQKRNWLKRRAKARARGENPVTVSSQLTQNETLKVGESDTHASLKLFALKVGTMGVNVMMTMYPRSEVILDYYYELRDLIRATFVDRRIEIKAFLQQIIYMARNLYTIIRQDIARIQEILRLFIPDPSINNNEMIAQTVNNELDRINETVEDVIETRGPEMLNNTEQNEVQSSFAVDTNDQMIFMFIHEICSKYRIKETTSETQIAFFHVILVCTTNYFRENTVKLFEEIFINNKKKLGDEKATRMASVLGLKTHNDFYPSVAFMRKVREDCDVAIQEFLRSSGIEYEEGPCSSLAQEIFAQYLRLLNLIYARVTEENQAGVHRMTCILQELSSILENKMCTECRKISSDSRSLYKRNIKLLGQSIAEEMMNIIEMPTTELGFFQSSLKFIKTEDIISDLKSKYGNHFDELNVPGHSHPTLQLEENNFHTRVIDEPAENNSHENVIMKLVKKLYEKINGHPKLTSTFESKPEMFHACLHFITEKFITELKLDAKMYQELKTNEELIGVELSKSMLKVIGMCASDKYSLFKTKAELMESEPNFESIVAEFIRLNKYKLTRVQLRAPKIFSMTTGDDGFITYRITCEQNWSDKVYKELIYKLFQFEIDETDCRIERCTRCVVIKSMNKVFTFTFPGEESVALVIQTDLERADDQGDDGQDVHMVGGTCFRNLEID